MDIHTNSAEELYTLYHKDIVRFFAEHLADREAAWDLCHSAQEWKTCLTWRRGTQSRREERGAA